jgi:hypothetical protein
VGALIPDQKARLIFNGVSLPLLPVGGLAVVFAFTDHPMAAAVTSAVFVVLVIFLLTVIRPMILRRVNDVSGR